MRTYLFCILIIWKGFLSAQNFAPLAVTGHAGVHATKINPAFTAYTPYDWHINILGAWVNVNNNYLDLTLPYSAYHLIFNTTPDRYKTVNGNPNFDSSYLYEDVNSKRKFVGAGAIAYLPSFTMKYKKFRIGWVNDAVTLFRVAGLDEPLAHAFLKELSYNRSAFSFFALDKNNNYKLNRTTLSANSFVSSGINVAWEKTFPWKQHLVVGATLKKVWGIGGGYIKYDDMQVRKLSTDQLQFDKTNIHYALYAGNGGGAGLDIGAGWLYHRPDYRQNGNYSVRHKQYMYKFGLSIMDIGSVCYRNVDATDIVNASATSWDATGVKDKFVGAKPDISAINNVLKNMSGYATGKRDEIIGLPTRMAITIDYQRSKYLFFNTQLVQSLRTRYGTSARYQSYLMFAPRYERERWAVSIPISVQHDYRYLKAGAMFRFGCFYIGSNSVLNFFDTRKVRDADLYFGFTLSKLTGSKNKRYIQKQKDKIDNQQKKKPDCEKM